VSGEIADLLAHVIAEARAANPDRPALIGIGGAQGSGKSYQCRAYAAAHPRVAHFSLDDVYLTRADREARGAGISEALEGIAIPPDMFTTRGPPGTHDITLAVGTIARLCRPFPTRIPSFDKRADDRRDESEWAIFEGPAETILFDGWCMGARPPRNWSNGPFPDDALNELEAEDRSGFGRFEIYNELNQQTYQRFFATFDALIYLRAPSWEIVRNWRGQQEEETLGRPLSPEENLALDRFVMHYERITRAMLAGHHSAGWIVHLDEERNVVRVEQR
jgi:D-glycerate 3-kinase